MIVCARPEETQRLFIRAGSLMHQTADLCFRQTFTDTVKLVNPQTCRYLIEQAFDVCHTDACQHRGGVFCSVRNKWHR